VIYVVTPVRLRTRARRARRVRERGAKEGVLVRVVNALRDGGG